MKTLILAALTALAFSISANAATITLTMVTGAGSITTQVSTDDTSAGTILGAYKATLNGDTTSDGHCGPTCSDQQVLQSMLAQYAAGTADFAHQAAASQAAAAAAAAVAPITAPH